MNAEPTGELRPAYRTLNEPARLLGLSGSGWLTVLIAAGAGYGWLLVSPLPWRVNVTLAVIVLGAPAALLVLREDSTLGPARLLGGALRWRARPARLVAPSEERSVRRGAVRLDRPSEAPVVLVDVEVDEAPWPEARGSGA